MHASSTGDMVSNYDPPSAVTLMFLCQRRRSFVTNTEFPALEFLVDTQRKRGSVHSLA
jgi:hypothetical protein